MTIPVFYFTLSILCWPAFFAGCIVGDEDGAPSTYDAPSALLHSLLLAIFWPAFLAAMLYSAIIEYTMPE